MKHASIPLRLHVYTPAAHLQTSTPRTCSTPLAIDTSIPPRLHVRSASPELQQSIPLLNQRLQRPSRALELHANISASLHRASRALEIHTSSISTRQQRTSGAPCIHAAMPEHRTSSARL